MTSIWGLRQQQRNALNARAAMAPAGGLSMPRFAATPLRLRVRQVALLLLVLLLSAGCASRHKLYREAEVIVEAERRTVVHCDDPVTRCALNSLWQRDADGLAVAGDSAASVHELTILEDGSDALAARVHLIRAARHRIALQTFIFEPDDTGNLILHELLAAAERGVKVQVILDQLFSLDGRKVLAQLDKSHVNFEIRVYNPTFNEAQTAPLEFAAGIVCCFRRFNQRSHNKLLLIDDRIAILGGRNISDHYFDLGEDFNYHDRDALLIGPEALTMRASFDQFWSHPRTRSLWQLNDVAKSQLGNPHLAPMASEDVPVAPRMQRFIEMATSSEWLERLRAQRVEAAQVSYFSDPPDKPFVSLDARRDLSLRMVELIASADTDLLLQTPYMVLSRPARKAFLKLAEEKPALRKRVSSNSLAATDAWPVYAVAHKHRRLYLEDLGFELHEFKPYPGYSDAALNAKPPNFVKSSMRIVRDRAPPLDRAIPRRSLHSKSIVIDREIGIIGSHNFDPRSTWLNTENGIIVWDRRFADALAREIEADMAPEQSWVVARKPDMRILTPLNQTVERATEWLPLFDLWPWRYATSYELKPECTPLRRDDPHFLECYVRVGDFPEVNLSVKAIYTRIITAFGVGLTPIL